MKPRVTIVITQRETFSRSGESLRSVFNETSIPFELVYVDGASPPHIRGELREMAEAWFQTGARGTNFVPE
jgi:hypothetical protein